MHASFLLSLTRLKECRAPGPRIWMRALLPVCGGPWLPGLWNSQKINAQQLWCSVQHKESQGGQEEEEAETPELLRERVKGRSGCATLAVVQWMKSSGWNSVLPSVGIWDSPDPLWQGWISFTFQLKQAVQFRPSTLYTSSRPFEFSPCRQVNTSLSARFPCPQGGHGFSPKAAALFALLLSNKFF